MVTITDLVSRAGNQAVNMNKPDSDIKFHLTEEGSDWLWAAFSIFSLLTVIHCVWFIFASAKANSIRKFLLTVPLFTNAILAYSYFTYASNLGYTSTEVEFHHIHASGGSPANLRQVFYVKYIGWFLAWPFCLVSIEVATHSIDLNYNSSGEVYNAFVGLLTGLLSKILTTEIYVLGLLIGALINSVYRWGYFTFSVSAQLLAMGLVLVSVIRSFNLTQRSSSSGNTIASGLVFFQLIVWMLYPICWGLSEGGNVIQPDSEAVFYGILDVITFGLIPSFLTFLNIKSLDNDFFAKLFHFESHNHEKLSMSTPRHSGDTAVPNERAPEPNQYLAPQQQESVPAGSAQV